MSWLRKGGQSMVSHSKDGYLPGFRSLISLMHRVLLVLLPFIIVRLVNMAEKPKRRPWSISISSTVETVSLPCPWMDLHNSMGLECSPVHRNLQPSVLLNPRPMTVPGNYLPGLYSGGAAIRKMPTYQQVRSPR